MKKFFLMISFLLASLLSAYGDGKEYRTYKCLNPDVLALDHLYFVYDPSDSTIYSAYDGKYYLTDYNGPYHLRDAQLIGGRYRWEDEQNLSFSEHLDSLWLDFSDEVLAYYLLDVDTGIELIPVSIWDDTGIEYEPEDNSRIPLWGWKLIFFLLAILPVGVLLYYIYRRDRIHPEPVGALIIAFVMGAVLSVTLALLIDEFLGSLELVPTYPDGYWDQVKYAFLGAAIPEECAKLFVLWLFLRRCRHFDEYMDGIVYAVCVGMGFACVENVLYVWGALQIGTEYALETAVTRALVSVVGHYGFAVILGYFYSIGHFDKGRGAGYIFQGLLLAILAHGLFDFLLGIMNYGWAFIVMFAFFGIFFYLHKWGSDHIREALERDKGKS